MTECYLCESQFELTEEVFQTALLYGRISIKRDIKWKDMLLTVYAKNSKDEDVLLCKKCLASALSRCAQEVTKTSIPMTAGIQFRGFWAFAEMNDSQPNPTYGGSFSIAKV